MRSVGQMYLAVRMPHEMKPKAMLAKNGSCDSMNLSMKRIKKVPRRA
jgi:hypothetical protein